MPGERVGRIRSKEDILSVLRGCLPELRRDFGVRSLELFGSYVRGEQRKNSDVDLLVNYDEEPGFYRFIELRLYLSDLLGVKVDLVEPEGLKREIAGAVLAEAVNVEKE